MPLVITRNIAGIGNGTSVAIKYNGLSEADVAPRSFDLIEFPDRSVQIAGTFNGGSVVIEGSNNGTDWQTLTDPQGNALIVSSAKIEKIQEITAFTRPRVNSGTGVNVNVAFLVTRTVGELDAGLLEGELNALASTVSALALDVSGHNVELADVNTELDARGVQVDQNIADIQSLEALQTNDGINIGNLQSGLTTAQGNITTLQGGAATAQANISTLQSGVSTAQGNIGTLQTSVSSLNSTVSSLTTSNAQLAADVNSLQSNFAALNEADVSETATFKKFTSTIKAQIEGLMAALAVGIPVQSGRVVYPESGSFTSVLFVSNATGIEGSVLYHTVTLSRPAVSGDLFVFSLQNSTTGASDYLMPPSFSNGVTLNNSVLSVPEGVSSFTVSVQSQQDLSVESTETYDLNVGGVIGVGSIVDDDVSLSPLIAINIFEAPYAMLSPSQRTAVAAGGGYPAFAVSRNDASQELYNVHVSDTPTGTYTQVLSNKTFNPSVSLLGAIGYEHGSLAFDSEQDFPATLPVNTIGLMIDTAGQTEYSLLDDWSEQAAGGSVSKILNNVRTAIYDSLPIAVHHYDTAKMFLLNDSVDPTLRADGATIYVKVAPVDAEGNQLSLSSITPIPFTCGSKARKPYPPRNVAFYAGTPTSVDDYLIYPTQTLVRDALYIYLGNSSRVDELTPSGYFYPAPTKESGVTYHVDIYNQDDAVVRTLNADGNGVCIYTMNDRSADGEFGLTKYSAYALKSGVRSIENIVYINQAARAWPDLSSVSSAQVVTDIQVTVTMEKVYTYPYGLSFLLSGTVISDNAYGAITFSNGVSLLEDDLLQIPANTLNFVMTIPTTSAVGKTLTASFGRHEFNDVLSTSITVSSGVDYMDLIGVLSGPSVAPTSTGGDPNQLNATYPQRNWYLDLRASIPQPNKAGNPRYVSTWLNGAEKTFEFEVKADRATTTIDYAYSVVFVAIVGGAETTLAAGVHTKSQGNGTYGAKTTVRFTNNTGTDLNVANHEAVLRIANIGDSFGASADPHVYSIRNFDEV